MSPRRGRPRRAWSEAEDMTLIDMIEGEGLSYGKTARALGVSQNAVTGRINRIRAAEAAIPLDDAVDLAILETMDTPGLHAPAAAAARRVRDLTGAEPDPGGVRLRRWKILREN